MTTNNKTLTSTAIMLMLVVSVSLSVSAAFAEPVELPAQKADKNSKKGTWSEENGKKWAESQPLGAATFWTGATCTHVATLSNPCSGWNTGSFAGKFYYKTPYSYISYQNCPDPCADTNIQLKNVTPLSYNGKTYTFSTASSISCVAGTNFCSNPLTWNAPYNDVVRSVQDVPTGVAIRHETMYKYVSGADVLWVGVADYLQYGY